MQTNQRTVKFTPPWDDSPIDISFIFADEAPAGKHGFLKAQDGKMVFEDGTEARFWGTNFNSAACFPSHEYSQIVAKRLAKFGMNMVRLHQMDGDWSTPNIFQFTRGKRLENTRSLDPDSLDRLDYLIYELKKNGIYIYMDLLTYRRFRSGDGVENAIELRDAAKKHSMFDERMIFLQKEFNEQLWNHYNPYTKLAYKDDPCIALTDITNESEIFLSCNLLVEPYLSRLTQMYHDWRKANGYPPVETVDFTKDNCQKEMILFKIEIQKKYFNEMRQHMLDLGVKIPITGTNWNCGGNALLHASVDMDFTDSHTYWCDWKWSPYEKAFRNASFLGNQDTWLDPFPFFRTADRPFFISEWDDPWPNQYRAEGTLYLASCCALQGWSGATIHTYRYDNRPNIDMIAAPITGEALSGVPYRSGVFDAFNDPCRISLFYHAALMVRRKDVRTSDELTAVPVNELMISETQVKSNESNRDSIGKAADPQIQVMKEAADGPSCVYDYPALLHAAEYSTVSSMLEGMKLPPGAKVADPYKRRVDKDASMFVSDTGELKRDLKKKVACIDTPRTKGAYGFLGAAGEIKLDGVTIRCRNEYAAVILSSLTDDPISESDNILLTILGNCDNTDAQYNEVHTIQYSKGHGPIEAEVVEAVIEIENHTGIFRVDAIGDNGMQVGSAYPVTKDGKITFKPGDDCPSIHYLIQKI